MVSAEMAPVAKVGGLADAVAALARALADRGHDVRVVLPLYGHLDAVRHRIRILRKLPPLSVRMGQRMVDIRFHVQGAAGGGVKVYLVECPELFSRPGIYADELGLGFSDALARASLHAQAALLLPRLLSWPADIVHAHDAHAVPALLYRAHWYPGPQGAAAIGRSAAGTVLTIHNLAHQEIHPPQGAEILGLPPALCAYPGPLEFHGNLNLMKAGILTASRVNTVSPTYARETIAESEFGCGLEGILAARGDAYCGILNGADYRTWDPSRDRHLARTFGPDDLDGKAVCREALCRELGLQPAKDKPLCGFVGRLVAQKGVDLLVPLIDRLVGDGLALAILGAGDTEREQALLRIAADHPGRVAFLRGLDEALAHRIYAGSDLFLMPSLFEPCGLSQMYALRYGTPPVVRRTGGLADTVEAVPRPDGTGFVFEGKQPQDLLAALREAEALWSDRRAWTALQRRGMARVFSWDQAAARYEGLYAGALGPASADPEGR
jgi:starch synthase